MLLYFSVDPPHRWVIVDRRERVLEDGVAESLDNIPVRHRRITRRIGVVPGELVTIHSLRIPAKSRAKAVAAVPYMLEEHIASNVEDIQFRLLKWVRGGESKVAVMSQDVVEHWRERLREFAESTDALVPEYLLLPRHPESLYTIAADGEGRLVIRTGELDGLVIDAQELGLWWEEVSDNQTPVAVNDPEYAQRLVDQGGAMVREWDIGSHFASWLRHGQQVPQNVDLRPHAWDSAAGRSSGNWLKASGIVLALALVLRLGVDGYDYVTLAEQEKRLDREAEEVLKQAFPDIERIVEPRAQMEQRVSALKSRALGGRFLVLLSVVAEAVPTARATVEEITFRDQTLLVTCNTNDFEALDRLKQRFDQDGRATAQLVSSGSRENSVSGRFRLSLAGS